MLETVVENIRKEKLNKARTEGKAEGKQEDVLKLLRKKFKEYPQYIEDEIKNTYSVEKLEEILLAILDINSPEDIMPIIEA